MSEPLDHKGYPTRPRQIENDWSWYYEQPDGITIVIGGVQARIPWRRVIAAVNHHFNAKRKRAAPR